MAKINFNGESDSTRDKAMKLELDEAQWAQLEELLEGRHKIAAIKKVKDWQDCSLAQAKTLVEAHHASLCKLDPDRFGKSAGSASGCGVSAGVFLLTATLGGMWAMWG